MVVTRFRIPVALFRMVVDFSVYEYVFYHMVEKCGLSPHKENHGLSIIPL